MGQQGHPGLGLEHPPHGAGAFREDHQAAAGLEGGQGAAQGAEVAAGALLGTIAAGAAAPRPDPADPKGTVVDVKAGKPLKRPVTLAEMKAAKLFAGSPLLTIGRLSVVPLTAEQYGFVVGE